MEMAMTISLEKNKCGDSEGKTNICALMDGYRFDRKRVRKAFFVCDIYI
jgi:hypothetical protein